MDANAFAAVAYMAADGSDPFTAFFDHDWASVGGWSLFVSLCLLIVVGSFREWWAPGARVKRAERIIDQQQVLIKQQADQISKLTESNEFTKYIMEQVVPRTPIRGSRSTVSRRTEQAVDPEGSTSP